MPNYSNSSLVNYTRISPNKNKGRVHSTYNPSGKIDKITIHHMAGNLSVETCASVFCGTRQASSNYGIGSDGRVGLYVDEKDRPWTSSSPANDYRAVTIEVANDQMGGQWHVSDKALAKCIELCVDICKRNGIKRLNYTGNKEGNLTKHEYFANTCCPGPYLGGKFQYIADQVNAKLEASEKPTEPTKPSTPVDNSEYETYKVVHGDSLWSIAQKLLGDGNKWPQIKELNGLKSNTIYSGTILKIKKKASKPAEPTKPSTSTYKYNVGDIVNFKGGPHYANANATSAPVSNLKAGPAKVTARYNGKHKYHLIHTDKSSAVYGWVDESQISGKYTASQPATPKKKSNEEIAREVINGKWGNGTDRKNRLTAAGYDYSTIQSIVNKLLK